MKHGRLSVKRRAYGAVLMGIIGLCVAFAVSLIAILIAYILYRGLGHITWELLSTARSALQGTIGIWPNIIFTLYIIFTTLIIVLPVGVGAAIYLNEYATNKRLVRVIEFATETLAGIPSIVYGMVGLLVFVNTFGLQPSILVGALTLSIMTLPTIVRTTQEALKTVPHSYREGAFALGATRWYMIRTIILPSSLDGIVTGTILSIGRMVGESAALLLTAGMAFTLVTNYFEALGTRGATLTVALFLYATEHGNFDVSFAIASILVLIVLLLNFGVKLAKRTLRRG